MKPTMKTNNLHISAGRSNLHHLRRARPLLASLSLLAVEAVAHSGCSLKTTRCRCCEPFITPAAVTRGFHPAQTIPFCQEGYSSVGPTCISEHHAHSMPSLQQWPHRRKKKELLVKQSNLCHQGPITSPDAVIQSTWPRTFSMTPSILDFCMDPARSKRCRRGAGHTNSGSLASLRPSTTIFSPHHELLKGKDTTQINNLGIAGPVAPLERRSFCATVLPRARRETVQFFERIRTPVIFWKAYAHDERKKLPIHAGGAFIFDRAARKRPVLQKATMKADRRF